MDNQTFCSECKNTTDALRNGHLECLFYAHDENGCPGDGDLPNGQNGYTTTERFELVMDRQAR